MEVIKTEFNSKKKKYEYIVEEVSTNSVGDSNDEIANMFGDVVEYN